MFPVRNRTPGGPRAGVGRASDRGERQRLEQSAPAPGVAALGSLFLSPTASAGMRDALTVSLLVQVAMVALTVLLSLRPPRTVS
ncbi:hypothetical protein [Streptomyces sp. NBC_00829]|uniref:hypothetical protein n=1 Tax=Streptomyces sp. NBC_00829 TaxID=2903679 RepID=UPI003867F4C3